MTANLFSPFLLLLLSAFCESANILVVVPFSSASHYKFLRPIGLELARRGHNVTAISTFEEKTPPKNYHQIIIDDIKIWEGVEGGRPNVFDMAGLSFEKFKDIILWRGGLFTTENALKSQSVIRFMKEDRQFDLVISELFYQEALYMFAHKYKAPLVLMTTYGNSMRSNFIMRNPMQLSTIGHEFARINDPKSFLGRLQNFYYSMYDLFWFYWWYLPAQEDLARKYFTDLSSPVPSLEELHRNASLVLMNSHVSYDTPAAYYPNFVEIGGLHLKEFDKTVPENLKKFIDEAEHGVIYVNFGSNVQVSELHPEKKKAFLNVFRKLKQRVMFKWEEPDLPGKPDNVLIQSWFPQKEILAHPNVKLFISHGGLIGFQEAVINKIPMLGIPIYCDQYNNLLRGKELGFASILDYHDIDEKSLEDSIREMLKPEYKKHAEIVSERFSDRPMNAMNLSMFWIEFVMRHKGAHFLKSPGIEMSYISYHNIDVYGFLLLVVLLPVILLKKCCSYMCQSKHKDSKIKKS